MASEPTTFPPQYRLHYSWEYRRFFQDSEIVRLSHCTLFRVRNELGHFRLGISLKARGRSVDRNRVKRRIREEFRRMGSQLGSYDYNVLIPGHRKMLPPYPRELADCLRDEVPRNLTRFTRSQRKASAPSV